MYGKSNMETYITICKIDSQREFAVCLRKPKQGLCVNPEAWDGEICPLMNKVKKLMEASWWERLTEGESESCSDGQGHVQ